MENVSSIHLIIDDLCEILKARCEIECTSDLFNTLPADEKVSFAYNLLEEEELLPNFIKCSSKSTSQAVEYRSLGNKAFCRRKDAEALKFYTRSVSLSLNNSQELAIAYANRSAVLFKLGKFDLCTLDINRALQNNYPDTLKYKLYERKGKCLLETGRYSEAGQLFLSSLSYLSYADTNEEQRNNIENSLNQLLSECNKCDETEARISTIKSFPLPQIPSRNEIIPNASDKIKIDYSRDMGRHVIAAHDIEPGAILAVEKPYASILLPDYYHSHCSNCFVRNEAMIPCDTCSVIMFCDETCRADSMERYHATECDILPFLLSLEVSKMELLAVRTLMIATSRGKHLNNLFEDTIFGKPLPFPIPSELLDINDPYISEDYKSVHTLEDNFLKRSPSDLFQRSAIVALLVHVIKSSSFFEQAESYTISNSLEDLETFTGSLLLKYLCIILCNAHEISEIIEETSKPESKLADRNLEIGAALYPLLSLINHSCDPNVVRHSYHDSVVLRSIQPIATNQQVFDNYGYHYAVHDLQKRQSQLRLQYFFTCCCQACKFDWPLYNNLPSKNPKYLHEKTDFDKLEDFNELEQSSKNFNGTLFKIMDSKTEDVLQILCQHLSLLHEYIDRPWKEYSACQEAIKECLAYQANHYSTDVNIIL